MRKFNFALLLGLFLLGFGLGRAENAYRLFINEKESTVPVLVRSEQVMVPLHFPATEEASEWTVSVRRDPLSRRVDVKLSPVVQRKVRGESNCWACQASGKCWYDYPPGSGLDLQKSPEYQCNGTGLCQTCGGRGKVASP